MIDRSPIRGPGKPQRRLSASETIYSSKLEPTSTRVSPRSQSRASVYILIIVEAHEAGVENLDSVSQISRLIEEKLCAA